MGVAECQLGPVHPKQNKSDSPCSYEKDQSLRGHEAEASTVVVVCCCCPEAHHDALGVLKSTKKRRT